MLVFNMLLWPVCFPRSGSWLCINSDPGLFRSRFCFWFLTTFRSWFLTLHPLPELHLSLCSGRCWLDLWSLYLQRPLPVLCSLYLCGCRLWDGAGQLEPHDQLRATEEGRHPPLPPSIPHHPAPSARPCLNLLPKHPW